MRIVALLLASLPLVAQIPGITKPEEKKEERAPDPLGRTNPRSTLMRFLQAAESGRYRLAARYLQVSPAQIDTRGLSLARDLQALMNAGFLGRLGLITERADGTDEDGLATNKENVGELVAGDESVDLVLVRVNDADAGEIWLVAQETLARVPQLAGRITGYRFVARFPEGLRARFLGLEVYQWLGVLVLFVITYIIAAIIASILKRILNRTKYKIDKVPQLVILLIAIFLHWGSIGFLQIPLLYRSYYGRVVWTLILFAVTWLVLRGIDSGADIARAQAVARGQLAAGSWIVLSRRVLKVLTVSFAGLIVLRGMGFDVSTALAGLGIGGIALGFGAQKTIENLFGGISVASDQVIRVGDFCNFGGKLGTVSDIGLRSTRVRTLDRTELSIPNGVLATMNVENFAVRDKILFQTKFGVLYDTSVEQMKRIVAEVEKLFADDPRIEWPGGRGRFVNFGDSSLDLEIWVYILTADFGQFVLIREELMLKVMQIVRDVGTDFAFPSRTLYVHRENESAEASLPAETNPPQ